MDMDTKVLNATPLAPLVADINHAFVKIYAEVNSAPPRSLNFARIHNGQREVQNALMQIRTYVEDAANNQLALDAQQVTCLRAFYQRSVDGLTDSNNFLQTNGDRTSIDPSVLNMIVPDTVGVPPGSSSGSDGSSTALDGSNVARPGANSDGHSVSNVGRQVTTATTAVPTSTTVSTAASTTPPLPPSTSAPTTVTYPSAVSNVQPASSVALVPQSVAAAVQNAVTGIVSNNNPVPSTAILHNAPSSTSAMVNTSSTGTFTVSHNASAPPSAVLNVSNGPMSNVTASTYVMSTPQLQTAPHASTAENNLKLQLTLLASNMSKFDGQSSSILRIRSTLQRVKAARTNLEQYLETMSTLDISEQGRLWNLIDDGEVKSNEAETLILSSSTPSSQPPFQTPQTGPTPYVQNGASSYPQYVYNGSAHSSVHGATAQANVSPAPPLSAEADPYAPRFISCNPMPTLQPLPRNPLSTEQLLSVLLNKEIEGKIPDFDGKPADFLIWYRAAETLLQCPIRTPATKFTLLKATLKGDATQAVRHITVTSDDRCVRELVETLRREYGNVQSVINAQYAALDQLPTLAVSNYNTFRNWVCQLKSIINTLESFNTGIQPRVEPSFYYRVQLKVPQATGQRFHLWLNKKQVHSPNSGHLLTYLDEQLEALRCSVTFPTTGGYSGSNNQRGYRNNYQQQQSSHLAVSNGAPEDSTFLSQEGATSGKSSDDGTTGGKSNDGGATTGKPNDKEQRTFKCMKCRTDHHTLAKCRQFIQLSPDERLAEVRKLKVHFRCLQPHNRGQTCNISEDQQACPKDPGCRHKHHELLHGAKLPKKEKALTALSVSAGSHHLELMKIVIRGPTSELVTTAMIDSGASRTVVDEKLAKELGIPINASKVSLEGIHGPKDVLMGNITFELRGARQKEWHHVSNVGTLPRLRIPGEPIAWKDWAKSQPAFSKLPLDNLAYSDVRIILGQDMKRLTKPITSAEVTSPDEKFTAYRNRLGWTITGPRSDPVNPVYVFAFDTELQEMRDLISAFNSFNSIEALGVTLKPTELSRQEDNDLERMKLEVVTQPDGRLRIPMLTRGTFGMPPSELQARKRLNILHKKFQREPQLGKIYHQGVVSDEAKSYIRKLSTEEAQALRTRQHWFLPHFPVFHPDKPEKCRRVLDAAARNAGICLNSRLTTGPNLLNSLVGVIIRFRCGTFAVNADITEMFSQIAVHPSDEDLLAFLWTDKPNEEPDVYVNTRHIFGAKCSPAIANFAVRHAAAQGGKVVQDVVRQSFYMDDMYWSHDNAQHVINVAKQVAQTLSTAGFVLNKWMANSSEILSAWPAEQRSTKVKAFTVDENDTQVKALGLAWNYATDTLAFSTRQSPHPVKTPAEVLSMLASVFDPTGIVGPFTLQGKLRMQEIWNSVKDWKKLLTPQQQKKWQEWATGIPEVAKLSIPRPYGLTATNAVTLHVFSDASAVGYGAVAYLTQQEKKTFVASKSRVVSTKKTMTIPRLELQALVVAIRLADTIYKELQENYTFLRILVWSDSIIVLYWLQNEETRYHIFVANRLHEVHEFVEMNKRRNLEVAFRHVPTADNPADLVSRGLNAEEFTTRFDFWTQGPTFLTDEAQWPENRATKPAEEPEVRTQENINLVWNDEATAARFNSLRDYLQSRLSTDTPSAQQLLTEEQNVIREVQADTFQTEIQACRKSKSKTHVPQKGPLQRLQLFLDEGGILRVISRLTKAPFLSNDAKYPIALPGKHSFTRLLIRSTHVDVGHQGAQHTRAELSLRFHIPAAISNIKQEIYTCHVCRLQRPKKTDIPTAPLHHNRLQFQAAPFTDCGMDHFGPLTITRRQKRWGLLFMCLTTRAVHIESTNSTDLTALLFAISRFVNRRGKPQRIRSDQGTSFVRAAKEQDKSIDAFAQDIQNGIAARFAVDFQYNPAGAPHWGGSWERTIKEIKKILITSTESVANLSHEAFVTILTEAEGILNRRPLAFDDNGNPLRPCDILNPGGLESGGFPCHISTLEQVRQVRQAVQHFWTRWRTFYLTTYAVDKLAYGKVTPTHLQPGDPVLLREGSNPLVDTWTAAKILEVHTSPDGYVRSALVETSNGGRRVQDVRRIAIAEGPALTRVKPPSPPAVSGGVSAPAPSTQ